MSTEAGRIRVLLADDQAILRSGLRVLIESADDLEVVGEASDGAEAVALALEAKPDVVVMDVRMPDVDGIEATRSIAADPELGDVRVLVLTTFELDEYVLEAMRAGASGFIGKGVDAPELREAIRIVARGDALLSPMATRALVARLASAPEQPTDPPPELAELTEREREMVELVATGLSNEEIASRIHLSPLTVKTHVNRAMAKLGARDRAQLVVVAFRSGLAAP